jgi:hypothetical protein
MGAYKTQQHRLVHRGQSFHLVSYEGRPADERRQQPEIPASWYLMLAGKRWLVAPQVAETMPEALDHQFAAWLDEHVFGGVPGELGPEIPSPDAVAHVSPAEDQEAAASTDAKPRERTAR